METWEKWGRLSVNQNEIFKRSINKLKPVMEEMNRQQLLEGQKSDGLQLPVPYSNPYARKRSKAGLQTRVRDLKFRGDFHKGIYAIGFENFVEMGSKDSKADLLEDDYGIEIFGLVPENKDKIRESLKTEIIMELKTAIGEI